MSGLPRDEVEAALELIKRLRVVILQAMAEVAPEVDPVVAMAALGSVAEVIVSGTNMPRRIALEVIGDAMNAQRKAGL